MNEGKERNLIAGFDYYKIGSGVMGFGMMLCMPASVTVEVFLRKNMGQRFFNGINFYAGMTVFAVFAFIFNIVASFGTAFSQEPSVSGLIFLIWFGYVIMGIYHFIYQWWRDESGKPVHSLFMGYPRLEPLSKIIMGIANKLLTIPVGMLAKLMPEEEREKITNEPVLTDSVAFTYRVVEPLVLVILSTIMMVSFSGIVGLWLLVAAIALTYQVNVTLEMERHNALDIRDQALEALEMKLALRGESEFMRIPDTTRIALQNVADKVEQSDLTMENIKTFNPSIAEAVAALNPKLQNLGKEDKAAA
jgi:hypothetical protein